MLAAEHDRWLEKRRNFLRARELAESDDAPGERNGADEAPDEELEAVPRGRGSGSPNAPGCSPRRRRSAPPPCHQRMHRRDSSGSASSARARDERPTMPRSPCDEDERDLPGYGERPERRSHADHAEEVPAPRRTGEDRPFSARMKRTLAARYQSASWLALMPLLLRLRVFFLKSSRACAASRGSRENVDRGKRPPRPLRGSTPKSVS